MTPPLPGSSRVGHQVVNEKDAKGPGETCGFSGAVAARLDAQGNGNESENQAGKRNGEFFVILTNKVLVSAPAPAGGKWRGRAPEGSYRRDAFWASRFSRQAVF